MKKLLNKPFFLFALVIFLLSAGIVAQEPNNKSHNIVIHYDIYLGSNKLGTSIIEINYTDNARYTIHSELFMPIPHYESHFSWISDAHGKIVDNTIFPEYYQMIYSRPDSEYFEKINFNQQSKKVIINSTIPDQEMVEKTISFSDHLYDYSSLNLQILIDLNNGHLRDEYKTIDSSDGANISRRVVIETQNELLKNVAGEYNAQKILFKKSINNKKDEFLTVWHDQDNQFALIQTQSDDNLGTPEKPLKVLVTQFAIK